MPMGGGGGGVAPKGPKSILYKHSHIAYQIKGNEVVQKILPRGHVWGSLEVKKYDLGPFLIVTQLLLGFLS